MRGWNASRAWVKIAGEVLAIKFPELEMSFLTTIRGPFLFLCGVALSGGVGAQQDLAAWRQGDIWNMRDDFKMVLDDQGIVAELPSTARYELRLASVGDEVIAGSGTYQVYRRSRQNNSANTLTGSGTMEIDGDEFPLSWGSGAKMTGVIWQRVADQALVRETITLTGPINSSNGFITGKAADFTLNATIDYKQPLEVFDFPLAAINETWTATTNITVSGEVRVEYNPSFFLGSPPPDTVISLTNSRPGLTLPFKYINDETREGQSNARHIKTTGGEIEAWYANGRRDAVDYNTKLLDLPRAGFETFWRRITGTDFESTPNINTLAFAPALPKRNSQVTLTGKTTANRSVTATIVDTGVTATRTADGSGNFSIPLPTPLFDDTTPASDDDGSYGVRVDVAQITGFAAKTLKLKGIEIDTAVDRVGWPLYP